MDLSFTRDEEAFRCEVRIFLAEKRPRRISDKVRAGLSLRNYSIRNTRGQSLSTVRGLADAEIQLLNTEYPQAETFRVSC